MLASTPCIGLWLWLWLVLFSQQHQQHYRRTLATMNLGLMCRCEQAEKIAAEVDEGIQRYGRMPGENILACETTLPDAQHFPALAQASCTV